jgi:hypothetical protein
MNARRETSALAPSRQPARPLRHPGLKGKILVIELVVPDNHDAERSVAAWFDHEPDAALAFADSEISPCPLRGLAFERRLSSTLYGSDLREAQLAGAELTHDLRAAAAGVVDPLALAAGTWRVPVDLIALWIFDSTGLDDDSVTTCLEWSYGSTEVTSEHSRNSRRFCRRPVAGAGATWSGIPDSNWRPSAWEADTLPLS